MPSAIVIINTEIGKEAAVMEGLSRMKDVERAYVVYGVYDIVAKLAAPDMDTIERMISEHVRKIDGVRSTLTLIVSKELNRG